MTVLDNCEHLIDAAAILIEQLLKHCPKLHFLVTSREALNIPGEQLFHIPTLSLPDTLNSPRESASRSEAVQLFLERVAASLPGFALTEENAPTIAQICRRLDGIPLAIELTTGKINVLTIEQIASRLDDAFHLLTGGSRTAPPRHQTLHAAVDWSYRLLSEAEQKLLRTLSVFAGGWTLEAAENVCADPLQQNDILSLLILLANKSLVNVDRGREPKIRYSLLETIRQFAAEKLAEQGETPVARNSHARWFLRFAEKNATELTGPGQVQILKQLEAEHDNLRAALAWSIEQKDIPTALSLAGALADFWLMHAHFEEGIKSVEIVLALANEKNLEVAGLDFARVLLGRANIIIVSRLHSGIPTLEAMLESCKQAYRLFQEAGEEQGLIKTLLTMGSIYWDLGDRPLARNVHEEALARSKNSNHPFGTGLSLCQLAVGAIMDGDHQTFNKFMDEGTAILRGVGGTWFLCWSLFGGGMYSFSIEGDIQQAKRHLQEGVAQLEKTEMKREIVRFLRWLSLTYIWETDFTQAQKLLNKALTIAQILGQRQTLGLTLINVGDLAYRKGSLSQALSLYKESLKLFQDVGDKVNIGWAMVKIGTVLCRTGRIGRAAELLQTALPLVEVGGDVWDLSGVFLGLADAARLQGDIPQAMRYHRRGLTEIRAILSWPEHLEKMAQIALLQNNFHNAAWLLAAAQALREELGTPLPPVYKASYERDFALIQARLSDQVFTSAWESGLTLTLDHARSWFTSENWPRFLQQLPDKQDDVTLKAADE